MILRHLEFLTALARERHFARAGTSCHVTQSTLSAGIKQLEESLGVLLVERGQRFMGLTAEGEKVFEWTNAHHTSVEEMVKACDVVTINAPLHPGTLDLFNEELIGKMRRGAYLVNTACGLICNREAVVRALESDQLAGYAGDVWYPQPAPKNHPWRTMPHHGMTPHISGTSLSAQTRYAAGTREILECFFEGRSIREEYLIVDGGKLAGAGAHSYSVQK